MAPFGLTQAVSTAWRDWDVVVARLRHDGAGLVRTGLCHVLLPKGLVAAKAVEHHQDADVYAYMNFNVGVLCGSKGLSCD